MDEWVRSPWDILWEKIINDSAEDQKRLLLYGLRRGCVKRDEPATKEETQNPRKHLQSLPLSDSMNPERWWKDFNIVFLSLVPFFLSISTIITGTYFDTENGEFQQPNKDWKIEFAVSKKSFAGR